MPKTIRAAKRTQSIEAQFAMAERVLTGLNKTIDAQLDRARDLEVEHARALYKSGKATVRNGREIIEEARRRVG
jgi:uncharacterized coiled-coil protein SlyX